MADLPSNSHVNVNDVETAQQAPVSEALLQKMGTNENTAAADIVTAEADIDALEAANTATTTFIPGSFYDGTDVSLEGSITGWYSISNGVVTFAFEMAHNRNGSTGDMYITLTGLPTAKVRNAVTVGIFENMSSEISAEVSAGTSDIYFFVNNSLTRASPDNNSALVVISGSYIET